MVEKDGVTVRRGSAVPAAPEVSVIIPAFKPEWLDEALESVRRQTFAGREIIVIDDGSPSPVIPRHTDDLILVRQENEGPGGARNRGFALARGAFVAMLDSDDRWRPSKLATQIAYFERHPRCVLSSTNWCHFVAGGDGRTVDRFDRTTRPGDNITLDRLFLENPICCSAAVVRREALLRTPGMAPRRRFGEDYGLWLRLATLGSIGFVDDVLVEKRVHPASLVHESVSDGSWFTEELAVYEEFLQEHPSLREERFVARALARLYFQRAYQDRIRSDWRAARMALTHSIRLNPFRARAWVDLLRATFRIR